MAVRKGSGVVRNASLSVSAIEVFGAIVGLGLRTAGVVGIEGLRAVPRPAKGMVAMRHVVVRVAASLLGFGMGYEVVVVVRQVGVAVFNRAKGSFIVMAKLTRTLRVPIEPG